MDCPLKCSKIIKQDGDAFHYATTGTLVHIRKKESEITKFDIKCKEDLIEWHEAMIERFKVEQPSDLHRYMPEAACPFKKPDTTIVLLADVVEGDMLSDAHDPSGLQHLPFCDEAFNRAWRKFHRNESIVSIIDHGQPIFSRTPLAPSSNPGNPVTYKCRTSGFAMIMTYVPNITFTYCILFGCDAKTKEKVFARLCDPNHAVHNPFFLVGILVELERERHTALVKAKINLLQNATLNRSRLGGDWKEIEAMDVWLDTHSVKNGLESWKAQLSKMIAAIGELSEVWIKSAGSNDYGREGWVRGDERMFKKWILDIVDDYDIEIRKCVMVMESMNIATKLAHTRANLEIAASTKRYYNQLRWTSLLTAIAVTAIFVASIFP